MDREQRSLQRTLNCSVNNKDRNSRPEALIINSLDAARVIGREKEEGGGGDKKKKVKEKKGDGIVCRNLHQVCCTLGYCS